MKNGGQAFPVFESERTGTDYGLTDPGMTLRDWFAGQALAGLLADGRYAYEGEPIVTDKGFAIAAFDIADAMLAERERERG